MAQKDKRATKAQNISIRRKVEGVQKDKNKNKYSKHTANIEIMKNQKHQMQQKNAVNTREEEDVSNVN